jgi:ubiquinone/menaquinone biosynthesis C-methylase UbiE
MGFVTAWARATVVGLGLAGLGLATLAACRGAPALRRVRGSFRTSSSPGAAAYEVVFERLLGGFYDLVAREVVRALDGVAAPRVLEVGPGPGGLALRVAGGHRALRLTGLDVDPDMAALAERRTAEAGLADRVEFTIGDVAAMPYPNASFDLVVSTFSVHHWADAAGGFSEIARVVRPGGRVLLYDLPDRWIRLETGAPPLAVAAADALPGGRVTAVRWPGPVKLVRRMEAVRET